MKIQRSLETLLELAMKPNPAMDEVSKYSCRESTILCGGQQLSHGLGQKVLLTQQYFNYLPINTSIAWSSNKFIFIVNELRHIYALETQESSNPIIFQWVWLHQKELVIFKMKVYPVIRLAIFTGKILKQLSINW